MQFTSRWAEEPITGEPHEIAEKAFQMDRADLARSNALLALIDIPGGRETFAEIEVARLTGIPIVFVGKPHMSLEREWNYDKDSMSQNYTPKYWQADNIKSAIEILGKFVKSEIPVPYYEFANEREKQNSKFGQQNHDSVISDEKNHYQFYTNPLSLYYEIPTEQTAKVLCQGRAKLNVCTWTDIALEEFCEAVYAKDDVERRKELVQLGAVITAWIECLDRKANQ